MFFIQTIVYIFKSVLFHWDVSQTIGNWQLILLSKIWLFFFFSETHIKNFLNSTVSKYMLIFSLALVPAKQIVILWLFFKLKLQNRSGTHAATWWQKLAADLSWLGTDLDMERLHLTGWNVAECVLSTCASTKQNSLT